MSTVIDALVGALPLRPDTVFGLSTVEWSLIGCQHFLEPSGWFREVKHGGPPVSAAHSRTVRREAFSGGGTGVQQLLAKSDALAKNLGISRALLIERGLKAVLATEERL